MFLRMKTVYDELSHSTLNLGCRRVRNGWYLDGFDSWESSWFEFCDVCEMLDTCCKVMKASFGLEF